ncbi:hypothetical protein A3K69_06365 [Candidatus Bathyarchaeota archaeon RBG_16_57_9]|nr:MAG: hypothetical protein A3K69_06365 [Candidatus Bathyarchaeota archaeon RBG_16_57_9]OGD54461.1 MAG: hypothetical protein A3K81_06050 [Candidatus Bathyarchaeota archaeon RBG_13_60_20]
MRFEATVKETIQRTPDVRSIRFNRPKGFSYLPGQYIFIGLRVGGKYREKHFTISSSPTEPDHLEITKRLTGHEFADALAALKVGDRVSIDGPEGDFTFAGEYEKILPLTGGIGITPVRSMLRYCMDMKLGTDVVLLYSNSSENDIVFKDELEEMRKSNKKLNVIHTITQPIGGWKGLTGRINGMMIREAVPDFMDRVSYVCGPPMMVDDMVKVLRKELRMPGKKVKYEYFPGY